MPPQPQTTPPRCLAMAISTQRQCKKAAKWPVRGAQSVRFTRCLQHREIYDNYPGAMVMVESPLEDDIEADVELSSGVSSHNRSTKARAGPLLDEVDDAMPGARQTRAMSAQDAIDRDQTSHNSKIHNSTMSSARQTRAMSAQDTIGPDQISRSDEHSLVELLRDLTVRIDPVHEQIAQTDRNMITWEQQHITQALAPWNTWSPGMRVTFAPPTAGIRPAIIDHVIMRSPLPREAAMSGAQGSGSSTPKPHGASSHPN